MGCDATADGDGVADRGAPEMRVEFDRMPGYHVDGIYPDYIELLISAFMDIGFSPDFFGHEIAQLPGFGPNGFPFDEFELRNWARNHFDNITNAQQRRWHLLVVDYVEDMPLTVGLAVSPNNGWNNVPTPIDERYSMVFYGTLLNFYSGAELKNITIRTTVHELGHQRAGLTHVQKSSEFHQSIAPNYCVMDNLGVLNTPRFCVDFPSADGDDFKSCYDNLLRNRTVD